MTRATGEPHTAAEASARSGSEPGGDITVHHSFEALVDAELEHLVHAAAADLGREPETAPIGTCNVTVSEELYQRLRAESDRLDVSMSSLVEKALAPALDLEPRKHRAFRRKDRNEHGARGHVSVSAEFFAKVKAAAEARGVSMASLVEDAVADVGVADVGGAA